MTVDEMRKMAHEHARDKRLPGTKSYRAGASSGDDEGAPLPYPRGMPRGRTNDTDPGGGLHTGSLNDAPARVGTAEMVASGRMPGGLQVPNFGGSSGGSRGMTVQGAPAGTAAPMPEPSDSAKAAIRQAVLHQPEPLSNTDAAPGQTLDVGHGKILGPGSRATAIDPKYGGGVATTDFNGAAPTQYGGTGIVGRDGQEISAQGLYGSGGRPTSPTGPMSYADQTAKIRELYPAAATAGTPENKLLVDSFHQGGSDTSSILDLAHSHFGPKTQAEAMKQDAGGVTPQNITADQAAVRQANMTPAERQAKQTSNAAALDAAGRSVTDRASVASDIGSAIRELPSTPGNLIGDAVAAGKYLVNDVPNAVGNFLNGLTGSGDNASSPSSPSGTPTPDAQGTPPGMLGAASPGGTPTAPGTPSTTNGTASTRPAQPGVPAGVNIGTDPTKLNPAAQGAAVANAVNGNASPSAHMGGTGTPPSGMLGITTPGAGQPTPGPKMSMATPVDDEEEGCARAVMPGGLKVPARFAKTDDDEDT